MPEFRFYVDQKFSQWDRTTYEIEAETEAEAIEIMKKVFNDDEEVQDIIDNYEGDIEDIDDTYHHLKPEDNQGAATKELLLVNPIGEDTTIMDNAIAPIQNPHV